MNVNTIQSLISLNATKIAQKHALTNFFTQRAREYRFKGEESYMVDAFKKASKYRSSLAKLHETQQALYAELKLIYRNNRIASKKAKLAGFGLQLPILFGLLSSHQQENELDKMLQAAMRKAA